MQKNVYALVCTILILMFCSSVSLAQERIWGVYDYKLASMNKDGSDFRIIELPDDASLYGSSVERVIKLSTGEILFVTSYGGLYDLGTISKITPSGFVKLYDINEYAAYLGSTMTEGKDGNFYTLRHDVFSPAYIWIAKYASDGTGVTQSNRLVPKVVVGSVLTATDHGVYGVSYGTGSNLGYIFRVNDALNGLETIYSFTSENSSIGGARPDGRLLEGRDGFLYGTTRLGGGGNVGVLFKVSHDGTQFTKLFDFGGQNGANPRAGLVQDENGIIYGTASNGGRQGKGTLFRVSEDGTGFQKLLDFADINSAAPYGDIQLSSDGYLYGAAAGSGTFKIKTDGTGLALLGSSLLPSEVFAPATPPDINIIAPSNGATGVPVNLVIQTDTVEGATHYQAQLSTVPDFTTGVSFFESDYPAINVTGLTPNTTYYARVSVNHWPYAGPAISFTTEDAAQEQPDVYVLTPAHNKDKVAIRSDFTAKSLPGATSYVLEICPFADFHDEVTSFNSPGAFIDNTLALGFSTTYYARVKTNLSEMYGKITSFTTRSALDYTFVSNPAQGSTGLPVDGVRITANAVNGASQYTIQVSDDPVFDDYYSPVFEKTSNSATQRTLIFNGLANDRDYYCRVKTNLSPEYGAVTMFRTAPMQTTTMPTLAGGDVYPNPTSDAFRLAQNPGNSVLGIALTDMNGTLVYEAKGFGSQELEFGDELDKGIYMLKLTYHDGVKTVRLVKM